MITPIEALSDRMASDPGFAAAHWAGRFRRIGGRALARATDSQLSDVERDGARRELALAEMAEAAFAGLSLALGVEVPDVKEESPNAQG